MSHVRDRESPSKLCLGQRRDLKQKGRRALSFPIRDKRLLSLLDKLFLKNRHNRELLFHFLQEDGAGVS